MHADDRSVLFGRDAGEWQWAGVGGFHWGGAPGHRIRSWKDAARGLYCGLVVDGVRRVLHSDVSGVSALYVRPERDATYFSTAIDPLVRAGGEVTPNWEAWAAILALGCPVGDRTPFAEIRRLEPWTLLEHLPQRGPVVTRPTWPWSEVALEHSTPAAVVSRLLDALTTEIRSASSEAAISLLSGGWDSRLLLALLKRSGISVGSWTVSVDDGREQEEQIAALVAGELGVHHTAVAGRPEEFGTDAEEMFDLIEYQRPMHPWLVPLVHRLRHEHGKIFDGLGGDVLIKAVFVTPEIAETVDPDSGFRLLWDGLRPKSTDSGLYDAAVADALRSAARRQLRDLAERFAGHPHQHTLTVFSSRTARGISLAPTRLVASARPVAMPFVHDLPARAALAVPLDQKLDGAFYEEVLTSVDKTLATLPSTNRAPKGPRKQTRRETSAAAIGWAAELLGRSPVRHWLSEMGTAAIAGGVPTPFLRRTRSIHALRGLTMLAMWWERYEDRFVDPTFPKQPPI
ncbi:MAG: asparagine synthase-related protein [Actinomycetota bacterium]